MVLAEVRAFLADRMRDWAPAHQSVVPAAVEAASRADRVPGTLWAEAAAARRLTTALVASGCIKMAQAVRRLVKAEPPWARTTEFLLSAALVELVPEARVLEVRARAERLAVPGRAVQGRADFQAASEG